MDLKLSDADIQAFKKIYPQTTPPGTGLFSAWIPGPRIDPGSFEIWIRDIPHRAMAVNVRLSEVDGSDQQFQGMSMFSNDSVQFDKAHQVIRIVGGMKGVACRVGVQLQIAW